MANKFCVLIALYNEAIVVQSCIKALRQTGIDLEDVYLVDDGSTDATQSKVLSTGFPSSNLLVLNTNEGKVKALQTAAKYFKLASKYDWIATIDGDTIVDRSYGQEMVRLVNSVKPSVVGICGHVKTQEAPGPLVAYRSVEYFLTHYIYKLAQGSMNVVTVLPGCASAVKAEVLDYLLRTSDSNMITEDMDWTIRIHKEKIGSIVFAKDLIVRTQDPYSVRDYVKQIHRWYRGLWQVCRKNKTYLPSKGIDLELLLLAGEGASYGALWLSQMVQTTLALDFTFTNMFLMVDLALFCTYVCAAAFVHKKWKWISWIPVFYGIRMLNCFVFLYSMVEILGLQVDKFKPLNWNKVARYKNLAPTSTK